MTDPAFKAIKLTLFYLPKKIAYLPVFILNDESGR